MPSNTIPSYIVHTYKLAIIVAQGHGGLCVGEGGRGLPEGEGGLDKVAHPWTRLLTSLLNEESVATWCVSGMVIGCAHTWSHTALNRSMLRENDLACTDRRDCDAWLIVVSKLRGAAGVCARLLG